MLWLFLFLLQLNDFIVCAQDHPLREYGVVDGLPQSQVHEVFQDSRGFIWIITRNGLSRFDGIEFINYSRRNGLPSNAVNSLMEDHNGVIWAFSHEGISRYTGKAFEYFPPPEEFRSRKFIKAHDVKGTIMVLCGNVEDRDSRLMEFRNGVYSNLSPEYQSLANLKINDFFYNHESGDFFFLNDEGRLQKWRDGVLSYLSDFKFSSFSSMYKKVFALNSDTVFSYDLDYGAPLRFATRTKPDARYMKSSYASLVDYFDGKSYIRFSLSFNPIGYYLDREGVLWITSENNLFRSYNPAFSAISDDRIGTKNIWTIAEDRKGHIWFGSLYGSLIQYDGVSFIERNEHRNLFEKEPAFYKGSRKMSNGDVWFATNVGIIIWNGKTFSKLNSLPYPAQVCYIYEDPADGSVLAGTNLGLFVFKGANTRLYDIFTDNRLGIIEGAVRLDDGSYMLSGHKGLVHFDGADADPINEELLPDINTFTLVKDKRGGIWVTSENGLYFRKNDNSKFISGLPDPLNVPANSIYLIDSTHIVAGRGSDVCIIDLRKFYGGEKDYYRFYDRTDGFGGSDCIDNGIIEDMHGRLWILTSNSVELFDPSRLRINNFPPVLNLTGLYFQDDSLQWVPADSSNFFYGLPELVKLSHKQNKIQITFNAVSTTNPERVMLQYRMRGVDEKWSSPSPKRNVIYENLLPGSYVFELKAMNADGIESTAPLVLNLRVFPSIWQSLAFRILYALLIISFSITATVLYLSWRQRKKAEEQRLRSDLSNLQMDSILRQFDPHFTFNVINSVGSLIMKGEKELAYDYITKLSSLLRTVLSSGSLIVRSMADELKFVNRYCELQKLRFGGRFDFSINVAGDVDLKREIPKMTIQTFVENAVKHGIENRQEGGKVVVSVSKKGSGLEIAIRDNGIGREQASKTAANGEGKGYLLISGVIELMNSKNLSQAGLEVHDLFDGETPSGTEVIIRIPDDYSFYFGSS